MSTATADDVLPALLLTAALALVVYGFATGRGIAARFARSRNAGSRSGVILVWAAGTALGWAAPALIGLALLDRLDALTVMPVELRAAAAQLGFSANVSLGELAQLGLYLGIGMAVGIAIIAVRRWLGRPPSQLLYGSPLAARGPDECAAATLLALSAGVSEELFFRLLLPLLVAMVTGSGLAGLAVGLVTFVALHRHQGWLGLASVTLAGLALTYLYLLTGLLWVAIAAHTVIDLNAFVIRPWLAGFRR